MSRQLSTVQFAASPVWMASARAVRSGPSHRDSTADPTWVSGACWRASPDSTRVTHCCMAWRPPAACAAGGAPAATDTNTATDVTNPFGNSIPTLFLFQAPDMGVHHGHVDTDPVCERVALGTGLLTEIVAGRWCSDCNPHMPLWALQASVCRFAVGLREMPAPSPFPSQRMTARKGFSAGA
jgi:hypothetical protein